VLVLLTYGPPVASIVADGIFAGGSAPVPV
jgi:hypothetical protein